MKRILLLILISGLLISCATQQSADASSETEAPESQAEAETENPLLGKWTLEFLSPVTGKDINHFKMQKPYLMFVDSGRLAGNNGCNNFAGYYTLEGEVISFKTEGFRSTKMYCEGFDEEAFIKGLKMANRFVIYRNSRLALMEGDAIILSLKKEQEEEIPVSD